LLNINLYSLLSKTEASLNYKIELQSLHISPTVRLTKIETVTLVFELCLPMKKTILKDKTAILVLGESQPKFVNWWIYLKMFCEIAGLGLKLSSNN
jgi:hypothetical protein